MDFDVSGTSQPQVRECLAVLLAGLGNELVPLSSDHGDEPCPKALLPIANKPMLDYPLEWLEQAGVKDVLLICPTTHRAAISHYIHSDTSPSYSGLRIDIQTVEDTQDLSVGTCSVLRHLSHMIQQDFILLPCDFIPPPSLALTKILNKFRTESTSDGCIATGCWFEAPRSDKSSTPEEWGQQSLTTPLVWDQASGTLLHIDTPDDQDRNGNELELRMSLLSRYPRTRLSTNYQDSHVYVCKRAVLDLLNQKRQMDSLREEFFPWLCKLQYQQTKREKYGSYLGNATDTYSQPKALKHSTSHIVSRTPDASAVASPTEPSLSMPGSPTGHGHDKLVRASLRVGVVIHRATAGYATRANTLHAFIESNRYFLRDAAFTLPSDPKDRALIDAKHQISQDSMIGSSTSVGERTSIKRSVIGRHCVIGKMVKISGSVLLDHCVIADGAKIEGSILGSNTKVGEKAELVRCVTQAGYEVEAGETFRNDKLDVSDWAAGPPSSSEGEGSSDEEESGSEGSED